MNAIIDAPTLTETEAVARKPADNQKPKAQPKRDRKGKKTLNVFIEASLRNAVDASCEKNRRSLTDEVSIALEQYLEREGLWPPKQPEKALVNRDS